MTLHLVLYSDGEPYDTTKKLIIESLPAFTTQPYVIHEYNLEKIKQCEWFSKIKDLPSIYHDGRRDGYYCVYKAFCSWEVYQKMDCDDILYYVDSSRYYKDGFTESIDTLSKIVREKGFIAGSVGDDYTNITGECCHKLFVWNTILPQNDNVRLLQKRHILASWYILTKNSINTQFMDDWIYWCMYTNHEIPCPLITYHNPGDQSIFNILVHKYDFFVFYDSRISHNENKDKNRVLHVVNTSDDVDSYFIKMG